MYRLTVAFLLVIAGNLAVPAHSAALIDPFVGAFAGEAKVETGTSVQTRKVTVMIEKSGRGFSVDWTTRIPRGGGKKKTKRFKIQFNPVKRGTLYAAGMRRMMFGKLVPLDPLQGDPYMWAAIRGATLFVYGMHVTEDGGYEFQVYERTVKGDDMTVVFKRFRDGRILKDITAHLRRE